MKALRWGLIGLLVAVPGLARDVTDATGRKVTIPDNPARVFAAGPPASVLLYALKPEAMVGWVKAPKEGDKPYLLPSVQGLPELGRLTGKDRALDLETLLAAKPDLIVDFGTVSPAYAELAQKVQAQTGIPYVLIDGSFDKMPGAIRETADILGVKDRGEALAGLAERLAAGADATISAQTAHPKVYLARGPEGLESAGPKSINAEIIARAGAENVVASDEKGLVTVSAAEVRAMAPEVILTIDKDFANAIPPGWAEVPAVKAGKVLLAPSHPFGFIDSPPSVNRIIGLDWLVHQLYPDAKGDLAADVKDFYKAFYHVDLDDGAVARLLAP